MKSTHFENFSKRTPAFERVVDSLLLTQWLFVLEQYAEFGLLFVLQWEYFLQLSEKYSSFSISIILLSLIRLKSRHHL